MSSDLFGTWKLRSLVDVVDGSEKPREYQIDGRLIYSKPDTIFVGLAYYKSAGYESNYYTGRFEIEGSSTVKHIVTISSDISRNSTIMERSFTFLDRNTLILRGLNHVGSSVKLIWEREIAL